MVTRPEVGRSVLAHFRENPPPPIIKDMCLYQAARLAGHERNELKWRLRPNSRLSPDNDFSPRL